MTITWKCASIMEDPEDDTSVRVTLAAAVSSASKGNSSQGVPGFARGSSHSFSFPLLKEQADQFVVGKEYSISITAVK